MSTINKVTLQLKQFNEVLDNKEGTLFIDYVINLDVYFVRYSVRSELTTYQLVTQKNALRSFSSMSSIVNSLGIEDGTMHQIEFSTE